MPLVAPTYLTDRNLPYASDVLYHDSLTYFLPTGFHPIEIHSIAGFPMYCHGASIALPKWVWDFCGLYFENTKAALRCLDILAPLREKHVSIIAAAYPRGRAAIDHAKELLESNPSLLQAISHVDLDMNFVSREVLSHVMFEIFLEEGYKGAIQYFKDNSKSPDAIFKLVAAVLVNRLQLFCSEGSPLLVYEHSWYPAIVELSSIQSVQCNKQADSDVIEHFAYKLFESVLLPIFGKVDSSKKAEMVGRIAHKQAASVSALKATCKKIARDVVLLPTTDSLLRQQTLTEGINGQIVEPLSALIRKPKRDLVGLLREFSLDSTVIGGLLAVTDTTTASAVGIAMAAGALSSGSKYLLNEKHAISEEPSQVLIEGIQRAGVKEQELVARLRKIALSSVEFPTNWQNGQSAA